MNKLVLFYDVLRTLRQEEIINGNLQATLRKEDATVFSLNNQFSKNLRTGHTKATISATLDCDRPQHDEMPHGHHGHRGHHHAFFHHPHHPFPGGCHHRFSIKHKLAKWTMGLALLQAVTVSEQADGSMLLELTSEQLPADVKAIFQQKLQHIRLHREHNPAALQDMLADETCTFTLQASLNSRQQIECIRLTASRLPADSENHPNLHLTAELSLLWPGEGHAS